MDTIIPIFTLVPIKIMYWVYVREGQECVSDMVRES